MQRSSIAGRISTPNQAFSRVLLPAFSSPRTATSKQLAFSFSSWRLTRGRNFSSSPQARQDGNVADGIANPVRPQDRRPDWFLPHPSKSRCRETEICQPSERQTHSAGLPMPGACPAPRSISALLCPPNRKYAPQISAESGSAAICPYSNFTTRSATWKYRSSWLTAMIVFPSALKDGSRAS